MEPSHYLTREAPHRAVAEQPTECACAREVASRLHFSNRSRGYIVPHPLMDKRAAAASAVRSAPHPFVITAGGALTFILTFLFRFLSAEFTNDHFMHLAEGRQVLYGEWPVRDYFDFGLPLQVLTSTVTLMWSGHNLYGEALVTVTFLAAGVAFVFVVSAHLSRSLPIAVAAASIAALSSPRLYNYPKAFFYVCALWGAWRYAQRPDMRRLVMLGLIVGVAFLYRHDHGIYIGIASIALFSVLHWGQPRAGVLAFVRYAAVILLVVAPFLLFVQFTIGLPWYISDLVPGAQNSIAPRFNALPITFDRSAAWVIVDPPAERRFNVRWHETLEPAVRASLEQKYRLTRPRAEGPATWSYVTTDESHANIRALVDDPSVVDTSGINRGAGVLAVRELWYEWLQRRVPLLRMHLLPGLFAPANVLPWFYYITVAVPLIGVAVLFFAAWHGQLSRDEGAVAAMSVLLSMIVVETLVRGSPDSRLPDVAATICVTAAWTVGRLCRGSGRRALSYLRVAVVTLVWLVTAWSVGTNARAGEALNASRILTGPSGMAERFGQLRSRFQRRPIDTWNDDEIGYRGLTRYALACTQPDDRLLVTWFEPIIYFYAEREFAGGRIFFDGGWHDTVRDQQFTVDRLRRQRVPIVFIRDDYELMFRKYFPLVAEYVNVHHVKAEPLANADQIAGYQVWLDKSRTAARTYPRLGLPCFR
jgi:hypothetical protein